MVGVTRIGERPYDNQATGGQRGQAVAYQMAKAALHAVADDGTADGLAHDETRTRRGSSLPRRVRVLFTASEMDDQERPASSASSAYRGREILAPPQPMLGGQHVITCCGSGGQTGATLGTAGRKDRAAGTGTHAQPEPVGLGATAVVRLEGALAHSGAPDEDVYGIVAWLSPCAHE
jgi:hypothetical protein